MGLKLLLSPHNDDAVLFACFTLLCERPQVITVFDSYAQPARGLEYCDAETRRREDEAAMEILGLQPPVFLGVPDDLGVLEAAKIVEAKLQVLADTTEFEQVWYPACEERGHTQHNIVGLAASSLWSGIGRRYCTYKRGAGKTRGEEVLPDHGHWLALKHRALACYESQMNMDPRMGCWPWFIDDLRESVE